MGDLPPASLAESALSPAATAPLDVRWTLRPPLGVHFRNESGGDLVVTFPDGEEDRVAMLLSGELRRVALEHANVRNVETEKRDDLAARFEAQRAKHRGPSPDAA